MGSALSAAHVSRPPAVTIGAASTLMAVRGPGWSCILPGEAARLDEGAWLVSSGQRRGHNEWVAGIDVADDVAGPRSRAIGIAD
jgi:hypothetical protein